MKNRRQKAGSLALWLAVALAVGCLVSMIYAFMQNSRSIEARRAAPPPIYTEEAPERELKLAPLPMPDVLAEPEGEMLR